MFVEAVQNRDPALVREMFDRVAPRYDRANHLLSIGCDFVWRRKAVGIVNKWRAKCVLDLATGSGDLALALQRSGEAREVIGADFSFEMLERARQKGVRRLVQADALRLPFADQSFDAVTVAFGLRNMQNWTAALSEIRRILTRDGKLLILDFSLPALEPLRSCYRFYLHRVLPRLCRLITNEKDAYLYLGASIETFPSGAAMIDLIAQSGFSEIEARPLTGGIVSLYTAKVRPD